MVEDHTATKMLTFNDLKVKHINEAEDDVEMRLAKQKDLARGTTPWALMVDCVRGLLDRRVRRDSRSRLSRHSSNVASRLYRVLDTSHEDFWEAHVFDTLQLRPATGFTCAHLGPSVRSIPKTYIKGSISSAMRIVQKP